VVCQENSSAILAYEQVMKAKVSHFTANKDQEL
jgi:hypothetical protein